MDDREMKLLQSHDPQGLTLWFERHVDALHAYVYYRVVRNEQLASEVVQETFLDAMKRIHRFDPKRGSMEAWLTTLSRNHITRALRGGGARTVEPAATDVGSRTLQVLPADRPRAIARGGPGSPRNTRSRPGDPGHHPW